MFVVILVILFLFSLSFSFSLFTQLYIVVDQLKGGLSKRNYISRRYGNEKP